MIRTFARRAQSVAAAARQFWSDATPASNNARLGVEEVENRVVPTVTAAVNGSTLLLVNDNASDEGIVIDTTTNAGFITISKGATATNNITAGAGTVAAGTGAKVAVGGITAITLRTDATKFLDLKVNDISGATALKQVVYTGSDSAAGDVIDLSAGNNANVYYNFALKGGPDSFKAPNTGVAVLVFSNQGTANSNLTLTPSATNSKLALDFRTVTTALNVNLAANAGTQIANYTNQTVTLAAGSDASKVTGVYGGLGNDSITGNDQANILIGGTGNDTLIGNGGNDELAATRDFSPAIAGTVTNGVATFDPQAVGNTVVLDLSKFSTASTQFNGVSDVSQTSKDLYTAFGFFNFGEGGSFAANGTVNFANDFTAANATGAPQSDDFLFGGGGNDGLFGFNNARVSAEGQDGNDVFSSNTLARSGSSYNGGAGADLLVGAFGFLLTGGDDNDTLTFVGGDATQFTNAIGGAGDDSLAFNAGARNLTVDASQGNDTISADATANSATNVAVVSAATNVNALAGVPLIQRVTR